MALACGEQIVLLCRTFSQRLMMFAQRLHTFCLQIIDKAVINHVAAWSVRTCVIDSESLSKIATYNAHVIARGDPLQTLYSKLEYHTAYMYRETRDTVALCVAVVCQRFENTQNCCQTRNAVDKHSVRAQSLILKAFASSLKHEMLRLSWRLRRRVTSGQTHTDTDSGTGTRVHTFEHIRRG